MTTRADIAGSDSIRDGVLGLRWGASAADVMVARPDAREVGGTAVLGIRAPTGLFGVRSALGDIFILTLDEATGLAAVTFHVAGQDVQRLTGTLGQLFGAPRSAMGRTIFGTFEHVCEWSCAEFGVRVCWTTREEPTASPPISTCDVRVQRGPLDRSIVDDMSLLPMARQRTVS